MHKNVSYVFAIISVVLTSVFEQRISMCTYKKAENNLRADLFLSISDPDALNGFCGDQINAQFMKRQYKVSTETPTQQYLVRKQSVQSISNIPPRPQKCMWYTEQRFMHRCTTTSHRRQCCAVFVMIAYGLVRSGVR
jgi:hypothetical protein